MRDLLIDGVKKFTCASPELERALLDAGIRANMPVNVTRVQQKDRTVYWAVKPLAPVQEFPAPQPRKVFPHNGKIQPREPIPASKFAAPIVDVLDNAPYPDWNDLGEKLAASLPEVKPAPKAQRPAASNTLTGLAALYEECAAIAETMTLPNGYSRREVSTALFIEMNRRTK